MSRDDLEIVAGHTRFGFEKMSAGHCIAEEGDACQKLVFVVAGSVKIETRAADHGYTVVEQMEAPYILQTETIFGYSQRYTHTFIASTDVSLITVDKEEVVRLSEDFLVFRLNLLNIFATQCQKLDHQQWRRYPETLRERIVRFFVCHTVYPAGPKTFFLLMNRLAAELNDSRLNVSRVLNGLQDEELLVLHRGRIEIPQLEQLLMLKQNT